MNLEERITLMVKLGKYLMEDNEELQAVKKKAFEKNKWFTEEFINYSFKNISNHYLTPEKLKAWVQHYHIDDNIQPQLIGIVMAGNIPLVGFHDFLSVFISGHHQLIKLSEKDEVLMTHLLEKLCQWDPSVCQVVSIKPMLKDCNAYIATGSNNSARYFQLYFGKYPSIIRSNKTSVAVLSGNETPELLSCLADDVFIYFGLGCRNVTKIYVPENYDFTSLLNAFNKYNYFSELTKYRNNYDYNLALFIMNDQYYMTNGNIILVKNESLFSPVSVLNYSFYHDQKSVYEELENNEILQCIVAENHIKFGTAQEPGLFDYADGMDTMQFLLSL